MVYAVITSVNDGYICMDGEEDIYVLKTTETTRQIKLTFILLSY